MGTIHRSNRGSLEVRLELWRRRFREFSSGRCTVEQFCKQVGVTAATFYYWRKKLADTDADRPASIRSGSDPRSSASRKLRPRGDSPALSGKFVPVRVTRAAVATGDVIIRLPSGAQVQIPASASEVIATVIAQVFDLGGAATIEVA